jgi:hypothetical protein
MKKKIFILIFLFVFTKLSSQILLEEYQELIMPFIEAIKNDDREKVINLIHYPLRRQYPIPAIYNEQEMLKKYDQVFDKILIDIIINSSIENDWKNVGQHGIMVNKGLIWFDYDGKLYAINYESTEENEIRNNMVSELKNNLHESLREFDVPILSCETTNYKMRIDLQHNSNYRLALWSNEKNDYDIPNIILTNGERIFDGSGGNHYYLFNKDDRQYILFIDVMCRSYGDFIIYKGIDIRLQEKIEKHNLLMKEEIMRIEN